MDNWICKSDSEIPVVCGDAFPVGDTINTNAIGHLKYVLNDVDDIRRSYFMLGFHLSEIRRFGIYKDFGYDNLKDFCINNVPVDYSTLMRCIAVYERFCEHDKNCFYTNRLNPIYEGFSFSQLVELMGLNYYDFDVPNLKGYSVAKLRDLKKFCLSKYGKTGYCTSFVDEYEASLNVVDNCDVAIDEPEHGNCDVATDELESSNCDVAIDEPEHDNCDAATEKDMESELNSKVLNRLSTLKGASLYSFVRGFPASHKLDVTFYDSAGKKVYGGSISCDVVYSDLFGIFLRLMLILILLVRRSLSFIILFLLLLFIGFVTVLVIRFILFGSVSLNMNRYKDFNGNFAILRKLLGGRYRLYIFRGRNLIFVGDFYSDLEAYFALCEYSDSFRRCSRSEFKDRK